ncbi:Phenylalanine--tRNA ligase beta subunit, cytoplasmic [Porphyridium purpureum]|uniref:phenylalanine--tRNA ligase n=1 Tax=Porphyridium purpureum TaxID=35688 RepID=A0A5J4YRB4_PORPP|nr:Phenylalanine--tRNA ligase beta subunit, cytoplasmic [Porphyridium purpureum]|eukprot:POR7548..scf236_6
MCRCGAASRAIAKDWVSGGAALRETCDAGEAGAMPTVGVARDALFRALGSTYTEEQFDELCFQYGLELDEVVTEKVALGGRAASALGGGAEQAVVTEEQVVYKIDVPANRYDLLCMEGLVQGFRVFLGLDPVPNYRLRDDSAVHVMRVHPSVAGIRPFVVCAVLRGLSMTPEVYQSLIDLQDKLHQNICRRRSLVAIGTHDLDTIKPPFTYQACAPSELRFVPLAKTKSVDGHELMSMYETDPQLKKYLPLIRDAPEYPLITDSDGTVLSLPPIINGEHSKISPQTKNMLIECTATDEHKAGIVLNTLCAMFSRYCSPESFVIEPVRIEYEQSGRSVLTPDLRPRKVIATVEEICGLVGVPLDRERIQQLLAKMQLGSEMIASPHEALEVQCPITRSDIIHACDVAEDVAVAHGFDNIPARLPNVATIGGLLALNQLGDLLRREVAQAGYTEVLTWVTVSQAENYDLLQRTPNGMAVGLANPKTLEFEQCRVSLLPGLLKTLRENRSLPIPVRLFEMGDVVLQDDARPTGARNARRLAALYCSGSAGFEVIQGLLERVLTVVARSREDDVVRIRPESCTDDAFFEGRRADIVFRGESIGSLGWIHPRVLKNFGIIHPCSAFEVDVEKFL